MPPRHGITVGALRHVAIRPRDRRPDSHRRRAALLRGRRGLERALVLDLDRGARGLSETTPLLHLTLCRDECDAKVATPEGATVAVATLPIPSSMQDERRARRLGAARRPPNTEAGWVSVALLAHAGLSRALARGGRLAFRDAPLRPLTPEEDAVYVRVRSASSSPSRVARAPSSRTPSCSRPRPARLYASAIRYRVQ